MNQRGFGFGAVLACIPLCLFATHCDLPASQEINEALGAAGIAGGSNQMGKLQLLITDTPSSLEFIESAVITISSIDLRFVKTSEGVSTSVDFCMSNTCVNGACIPVDTNCDDGDACTVDACDSTTGTCSHTPITCATDEVCVDGQCLFTCANDAACDDGDPCTTEVCTNGACVTSDTCVSPDPCTNVSCNPNTGACIFVASICGPGQVCFGGGCVTPCGTDTDCDDGDMCTIGVCGPDYACEFTTIDCDDGDTCTTDSCDPNTGVCANDPVVCAANEVCVDSVCYTACVNSTECNGAGGDDDDSDSDEDSENDSDDDFDSDEDSGDKDEDSGSDSDNFNDDSGGVENDTVDEDSASDPEAGDDESIGDDSNNGDSASDDENADGGDAEDGEDAENGGIGDDNGTNKDLKNDIEAIDVDDVKLSLASDDDSQGDSGNESDGGSDQDDSGDDSDDEQDDSGDDGDSDGGSLTQKGDDSDDNTKGSFIVIFEEEKDFDLLQLQNGRTDLLAYVDIPAGSYSQMRLNVSGGEVTLTDGRVFPLRVPSGEQTGIKLQFGFDVYDDQETTLLLDVDLSRAFKPIPGGQINDVSDIRDFIFRPSLAMRLVSLHETGSISGTVSDADGNLLADVAVTASQDGEEVTSTATGADGIYVFLGLSAGDYDLRFSISGYEDAGIEDIAVSEAEDTVGADIMLTLVP